ncbi:NAD-specific glutamate dehydrogenase [compost metagenome]
MDHHRRLAVFIGGELLGTGDRDGGVARNHLLHQPAHGFKPQGQRDHIKQQQFATIAAVAGQGIGLDRGTDGDHLIRIDFGQRGAAKQGTDRLTHARNAGRTTDHDHRTDLFKLDTTVTHGTTASLEATGDHRFDQRVEGAAGQLSLPVAIGDTDRISIGQGFLGRTSGLQQLALGTRIKV